MDIAVFFYFPDLFYSPTDARNTVYMTNSLLKTILQAANPKLNVYHAGAKVGFWNFFDKERNNKRILLSMLMKLHVKWQCYLYKLHFSSKWSFSFCALTFTHKPRPIPCLYFVRFLPVSHEAWARSHIEYYPRPDSTSFQVFPNVVSKLAGMIWSGNTGCFTHLDPFEMQNFRSKNFQIFKN